MKYPINTSAIIDVTKPPYCADNTGKVDCTEILRQILDDILIRQVTELQATYDKLIELSDGKKEDAYIGVEGGRVQDGNLNISYPENEPSNKIIYFPNGTYLVSDTVTYTLDNLKGFWYWNPKYENCRNIHVLGESREGTVIRLADGSDGFGAGEEKPLISFYNNQMDIPREKGEFTNVAFMNTIEDITIDCGKGNDGAVGIRYISSNCGRIENVTIRAEHSRCGVYVANGAQAVFTNISACGFDYGFDLEMPVMMALDDLDVSGCSIAGVYTTASPIKFGRISSGNIPAVKFRDGGRIGR